MNFSRLSPLALTLGILSGFSLFAAEPFSDDQREAGIALAAELRMMQPVETQVTGTLRIRSRRTHSSEEIPVMYQVVLGDRDWETVFETRGVDDHPAERLVVAHGTNQPNRYLYSRATNVSDKAPVPRPLEPEKLSTPFAGSDFAVSDLGLEFLHWPEQYRLKGEMRLSHPCYVLESRNSASPGGISRVKTWIEKESGGILIAEFYDAKNTLVKEFSLSGSSFKKINGKYQLEKMEIRSPRAGSETVLKFNLPRD